MRINISDIVKKDGASINIDYNDKIPQLNEIVSDIEFDRPVGFKGILTNISGMLRLEGTLKAAYTTRCYRCIKDISNNLNLSIKEDFISADKQVDIETYTYEGNTISIDKALIDNIFLNLPMKQVCDEKCKGLCPHCGTNLNEKSCECIIEEPVNPKMEALKKFFD